MIIVAAVIIAEEGRDLPDVRMARITPRLRASTNNGGCSSGLLLADDDDDDDNDGGAEVVADGGDDDDDDDGRAMIMYFFGLGGFDLRGESLVHVPAISGRSSLSVAARCGVKTVARHARTNPNLPCFFRGSFARRYGINSQVDVEGMLLYLRGTAADTISVRQAMERGGNFLLSPALVLARYIIPFLTGLYLLRETTF